MGTSKGYIAPSTPKWTSAKRWVTIYLGNSSEYNKKAAISKFANAMNSNETANNRVSSVFSNFVSFVSSVQNNGLSQALNDIGKKHLESLPPEEAFLELMNSFSEVSTIDDNIANLAIAETFEVLKINGFEDLSKVGINELIKELVCQFAQLKFAQMFDKQIRNKCEDTIVANRKLKDLQDYIYFTLKNELVAEKIAEINPQNLANEEIIVKIISVAFDCLEKDYD